MLRRPESRRSIKMCGIAGIYSESYRFNEDAAKVQAHRGPDDYGCVFSENGQLYINRLAILDVSSGLQPMLSDDKDVKLVFNGEIFNAVQLRNQLEKHGVKFKTQNSDTEVILRGYLYWGVEIFKKLNGMFAIAIIDDKKFTQYLVRDTFGIKPLFYSVSQNDIFFASEISTLKKNFVNAPLRNIQVVAESFCFKTRRSHMTAFDGIVELPSGTLLIRSKEGIKLEKFEFEFVQQGKRGRTSRKSDGKPLRKEITAAVERWCQSDVPITLSLSGGLDSSIIAYSVSNELKINVPCYSFGVHGHNNELSTANITAKKFKLDFNPVIIQEEELAHSFPEMIKSMGEPYFGDIPAWFIYRKIQQDDYKVVLTGTGADELFGNYGKAKITLPKIARCIRDYKLRFRNLNNLFFRLSYFPNYFPIINFVKLFKDEINVRDEFFDLKYSLRDTVYIYDKGTQLTNEFLAVTDRFSSHFSVEARTPFLDQQLEYFVLNHIGRQRYRKTPFKYVLRQAYKSLLPSEVILPKKTGFTTSNVSLLNKYMSRELAVMFDRDFIENQGIFKYEAVRKVWDGALQKKIIYEQLFWSLYVFQVIWTNENTAS